MTNRRPKIDFIATQRLNWNQISLCILSLLSLLSLICIYFTQLFEIDHDAASIRKRPLIKKYYLNLYLLGPYSIEASNGERLLMARLQQLSQYIQCSLNEIEKKQDRYKVKEQQKWFRIPTYILFWILD